MIFVFQLSGVDGLTLSNTYKQSINMALRRRAHAILLRDKGYAVREVGDILSDRSDEVTSYLNEVIVYGLQGDAAQEHTDQFVILDD